MFKELIKALAWRKLEKFYKARKRKVVVCNINNAKSIGILWCMKGEQNASQFENFRQRIKKRNINVLGLAFIDESLDKETISKAITSGTFSNKDINLLGEPKCGNIKQFVKKKFDILVDLSLEQILPLSYVVAHSNALFKTGRRWDEHDYNDLSIEIDNEKGIGYLAEQAVYYLEKIY